MVSLKNELELEILFAYYRIAYLLCMILWLSFLRLCYFVFPFGFILLALFISNLGIMIMAKKSQNAYLTMLVSEKECLKKFQYKL